MTGSRNDGRGYEACVAPTLDGTGDGVYHAAAGRPGGGRVEAHVDFLGE